MALKLTAKSVVTAAPAMKMPVVGLGTMQFSEDGADKAISAAIDAGYRHLDTAYLYFNEKAIGKVLKKLFDSGKIKREELFITTKLPRHAMRAELIEEYLQRSLTDLQLSYVDLYLIHHPVGFEPGDNPNPVDDGGYIKLDMSTDHVAIWKAMEKEVDAGQTKAIGVSNFTIPQVDRILKNARIPPAVNQVEFQLYFQQKELREHCETTGVRLTAFSPLGSPGLVTQLKSGGLIDGSQETSALEHPVVQRIAKAHKKSPAQVILRHILQLGIVVIPKSANPDRIKENIQLFDFELSGAEVAELSGLDRGEKGRIFNLAKLTKGYDRHPECPVKL